MPDTALMTEHEIVVRLRARAEALRERIDALTPLREELERVEAALGVLRPPESLNGATAELQSLVRGVAPEKREPAPEIIVADARRDPFAKPEPPSEKREPERRVPIDLDGDTTTWDPAPEKREPASEREPKRIYGRDLEKPEPGTRLTRDAVLAFVNQHGRVKVADVMRHFGATREAAKGHLGRLRRSGDIDAEGARSSRVFLRKGPDAQPGVERVTADDVLAFIAERGQVRSSDIRRHFNLSRQTVSGKLSRLQKTDKIEGLGRLNDPTGMIYRVKRDDPPPVEVPGSGYSNISEGQALALLNERGAITVGDVRREFGTSRYLATKHMVSLAEQGKARATGKGAGTKYHRVDDDS